MANTGGLTWDFGVVPYNPAPQQWSRRHDAMRQAHADWHLTGVMESHHFGFWPSIVSEVAKAAYQDPAPDPASVIRSIAERDFGDGADLAVQAWQAWSDATANYVPTNEDQYGPFRIGPAYPLTFLAVPTMRVSEFAMFGDMIVNVPYRPENRGTVPKTAAPIRIEGEIASLTRSRDRWEHGNGLLEQAIALAPDHKAERNSRMLNLGRYMPRAVQTTINVKEWWKLSSRVMVEPDQVTANDLLDRMIALGEAEIANCEATIPIVGADSRLGWEPTMEYLGDADHIRWKMAHLRQVLDKEIPGYRESLSR
jgi:hypothetical protein